MRGFFHLPDPFGKTPGIITKREPAYRFYLHQHPFVQELIQKLIRGGVRGLLSADTEYGSDGKPVLYDDTFFSDYRPTHFVKKPFPVKELDFSTSGAYAVYNWELFFHVPFLIAVHLSKNGRYAEAQRWFHYIFDPTDDSDDPTPERYWKVHPFRTTDVKRIEQVLINLSSGKDSNLRRETIQSINAWRENPFRPHLIARYRPWAYMYKTVMAYLDNLIAWGDALFRQDTPESVDEALQLYVMAANILGPRPQSVPMERRVSPKTYASLREDMDRFGNALVDLEAELPFDLAPASSEDGSRGPLSTLGSVVKALYFCVPINEKLFSYWDTVADRLFKIRNSLDITGRFRRLPLFAPPIDPALLARATAAGVDVGAVISGLEQPLPLVRFSFLIQKATELCKEVQSLGNQLLSVMEKEDNEALAILRTKHERTMLEMAEQIRFAQWQEAVKSREALEKALALALARYIYYERQLGRKEEEIKEQIQPAFEALAELDRQRLERLEPLTDEDQEVEGTLKERPIEVDIAQDIRGFGGKIFSSYEKVELEELEAARKQRELAATWERVAAAVSQIPTLLTYVAPLGTGGASSIGGPQLAVLFRDFALKDRDDADRDTYEATKASRIGTYSRREQEWAFQSNLARGEITQILKQLRAAQIREAIAEFELRNHRKQIKHAQEVERFLNETGTERTGKKTNRAFYAWMKREVRGLYSRCFQLAFDVAKKAERALQHELGDPDLRFIRFDYTSGKEGLLAGEKLYLDLKRMEIAFHENNRREYELTKNVSLLQLDPLALIQLRTTGRCTVHLPEELFDMDGPGHYFRRIKSVAVSIPCVTGPYSGVNLKLTLLKSSIRKSPTVRDGNDYPRRGQEDDRFSDFYGSLEAIVTSTGQQDSGLFETNLREERYLPFENSGVISRWLLELPADPSNDEPAQFDYDTITDVILHIRYTAREGGERLRRAAVENLKGAIEEARAVGSVRLFSIRHEFPSEWTRFRSSRPDSEGRYELTLTLRPEHYSFWSRGRLNKIHRMEILARHSDDSTGSVQVRVASGTTSLDLDIRRDQTFGNLLMGTLTDINIQPVGTLTLSFNTNAIEDIWLAVTWGKESS